MTNPQTQSMSDRAMAEAFRKAGIANPMPPDKRLERIAVEAFAAHPGNNQWDSAKDHIFQAVKVDADLLWELFSEYRATAVQQLMTKVKDRMHQERKLQERSRSEQAGGGQTPVENQHADATTGSRHAQATAPNRGGHSDSESHAGAAPSVQPHARRNWSAGETGPGPARQPAVGRPVSPIIDAGMQIRAEMAAKTLSKLDTFLINNRPIGDCTPAEALEWAKSRKRDLRFIEFVTSGLPFDKPIRMFVKPNYADDMYARAQTEIANAA